MKKLSDSTGTIDWSISAQLGTNNKYLPLSFVMPTLTSLASAAQSFDPPAKLSRSQANNYPYFDGILILCFCESNRLKPRF